LPAVLETPLVQVERMDRGNLHYGNWFLTWPGYHAPLWGLPERSPWTPGWPVDLHLVYRHALYGAPKLGLWQTLSLGLPLLATGVFLARRPALSDRQRLILLSVAFGAAAAVAGYAQSFSWALPWWERFAWLRAIQAPYRLLGPVGYGVALATGG